MAALQQSITLAQVAILMLIMSTTQARTIDDPDIPRGDSLYTPVNVEEPPIATKDENYNQKLTKKDINGERNALVSNVDKLISNVYPKDDVNEIVSVEAGGKAADDIVRSDYNQLTEFHQVESETKELNEVWKVTCPFGKTAIKLGHKIMCIDNMRTNLNDTENESEKFSRVKKSVSKILNSCPPGKKMIEFKRHKFCFKDVPANWSTSENATKKLSRVKKSTVYNMSCPHGKIIFVGKTKKCIDKMSQISDELKIEHE